MKLLTHAVVAAVVSLFVHSAHSIEPPEGVVFCHETTKIEFAFDRSNKNNDVILVVDGTRQLAMTAYSWFGSAQTVPKDFKFAILGKGDFDPLLVFDKYLIDAKQKKYTQCN